MSIASLTLRCGKPHCRNSAAGCPIEIQERMSTLIVVAGMIAAAHAVNQ